MGTSKIEWCDKSWNPITGCSHAGSPGCDHCWARRMANRLKGRYGYPKDDPFKVTFHPDRLEEPLHWKKPSRIFVCSMGDIFHDNVDAFQIGSIFIKILRYSQHIFLILTKRPQRFLKLVPPIQLPPNIWLGVSVENQQTVDERIPILLQIPAAKRFVSVEPMLEEINFMIDYDQIDLLTQGIDWVICGGETGPKARPMHPDWVKSLRDQCQAARVPFFFKSWGDAIPNRYLAPGIIDGKKWREFPIPEEWKPQ